MSGDDPKIEWVRRVLGVAFGGPGTAAAAAGGPEAWSAARGEAIATLSLLESKVRQGDHPGRDRAVILLRAIRANLTEKPETAQQIEALARYIASDDIVAAAEAPNVFGIKVTLKQPLLRALNTMGGRGG